MQGRAKRAAGAGGRILLERLEGRELLSAMVSIGGGMAAGPSGGPTVTVGNPATQVNAQATSPAASLGLSPVAVAGQQFIAAVARIAGLPTVSAPYVVQALITWGDGASSLGGLVPDANGTTVVLGAHKYRFGGNYQIIVQVLAVAPAGSFQPLVALATTASNAAVVASTGGYSLNPRALTPFGGRVGIFNSRFTAPQMSALIDWGDGQASVGSIVRLFKAGFTTTFAVNGTHTYAAVGSHLVRVTILTPNGFQTLLSAVNVLPSVT